MKNISRGVVRGIRPWSHCALRFCARQRALTGLFEESFSCVVWKGNPLVGDTLSIEQYKEMGHVAATFGDSRSVSFEGLVMANLGISRTVEVTTTNFNTLPQLVIGTTRIATVMTRLARLYAHYLPLRILPLPMNLPPLVEMMQWHAINTSDPAHIWMRRVLQEQAQMYADAGTTVFV